LSSDEACAFERQHHLVNRGWADAKVFLYVGFGRRAAVQARVQVDKRQILPLLGREGCCRATHASHPIQLFVRASIDEEARMNLRYRVELSQTERAELTALLRASCHRRAGTGKSARFAAGAAATTCKRARSTCRRSLRSTTRRRLPATRNKKCRLKSPPAYSAARRG
jgi:hypothetical protein